MRPSLQLPPRGLFGWPTGEVPGDRDGIIEAIGVPSDAGNAYVSGARLGPSAIRAASLGLAPPAVTGTDRGDVEVFDGADWAHIVERIRTIVADTAQAGAFPLVLGGDHAVSYAAVAALERNGPLDIAWFDAHTDFCPLTEPGWHNHKQVLRRIAGLAHVGRMLVIGHRGLTYFDETRQSANLDVIAGGPLPEHWLRGERPLYISLDIDSLDPCYAPGTGHPVPGGLELPALCHMLRLLARERSVVGADVMEVNPLLDCGGMTSLAAATALAALLDGMASRFPARRRVFGEEHMPHLQGETST
jgi:agmatinase